MPSINLGGIVAGDDSPPYVIAEIGVNHEGSLELAKELIGQARQGGAQAAKFQTYKAGKLASRHSPAYWDTTQEPTRSQFELFQKYDSFGPVEYEALAACCREQGIHFVSTPFDDEALDFLAPLMPFIKVASSDLTNLPFLRRVAAKGKPVVLSTGASTLGEIDMAAQALLEGGAAGLALLHCVLNYPTLDHNAHLGMISGLQRAYPELVVGYSDHTLPDPGLSPLVCAYLLGARVLEKHFTHDKTLPGNDHYHAMDAADLAAFSRHLMKVRALLGPTRHKRPLESEAPARAHARRSIVLKRAVQAGQALSEEDLTYKRPASGISPLHWDEVLGARTARDLPEDHVLQWRDLEVE